MTKRSISLQDIRTAAAAILGQVEQTPCVHSAALSKQTGADVFLKLENLQFTGSFKERGALFKLLSLTAQQREHGVIAMSAGNHAQAVARHAQRLGIKAVIVMPRITPSNKVERTREFGAEVILHGESVEEAGEFADELVATRGLYLVHPYDDVDIIAGQGTIALEMLAQCPDLDVLIIPVGGGGLIAGNAIAAKALKPAISIVGVQTARFPSMVCALSGHRAEYGIMTIAEGIAVKQPGRLTLPIVRELVDDIILTDEEPIEHAVLSLLEVEKTVAEGAGAAGLAALVEHSDRFAGRRVGLIICGGNIDLPILSSIIQRGLVRTSRLVRLRVGIRDVPGSLAAVTTCIADTGANIVQVSHQRTFTHVPLRAVNAEFVLHTRGPEHVKEIIDSLRRAGYATEHMDTSQ